MLQQLLSVLCTTSSTEEKVDRLPAVSGAAYFYGRCSHSERRAFFVVGKGI
jgi:hypothetical protein